MNKAEEACTSILKVFGGIPEVFEQNRETIDRCELETQDLLHEIELSENQTTAGGYKLYKALREVRRLRRQCKDENEQLQPLVEALKQQETFRLKLYKVHDRIKDTTRVQAERRYVPRVRDDLTIAADEGSEVG